jgi:hypothetical protein
MVSRINENATFSAYGPCLEHFYKISEVTSVDLGRDQDQ